MTQKTVQPRPAPKRSALYPNSQPKNLKAVLYLNNKKRRLARQT